MDDDQQFCLRWNNHQSTLISVFDTLLENETLVDCTLAAEGKFLKAHKVVLSACSPYFATLLQEQYDKHPIFILKDVKYQELRAMMDYMYRGEVNISQDQLAALLKAAESLQIKGLSDNRTGGGSSSGGGGGGVGGVPKHEQHRGLSVPTSGSLGGGKLSGGYTLEQTKRARMGPSSIDSQDMSGSREGSSSPTSRRRRKVRRRSIENALADVHDNSNSSQIQPNASSALLQQSNASLGGVGAITAAASALASQVPVSAATLPSAAAAAASTISTNTQGTTQQLTTATNVTKKTENVKGTSGGSSSGGGGGDALHTEQLLVHGGAGGNLDEQQQQQQSHTGLELKSEKLNHKQQKSVLGSGGSVKDTASAAELVIEPKSEYDDDGNDETVEDLTLDDEDMGMEDLDHNAGTSHGNEGSSQGYAQWQHDRSQDEVFMATQEAQQRDPQDLRTLYNIATAAAAVVAAAAAASTSSSTASNNTMTTPTTTAAGGNINMQFSNSCNNNNISNIGAAGGNTNTAIARITPTPLSATSSPPNSLSDIYEPEITIRKMYKCCTLRQQQHVASNTAAAAATSTSVATTSCSGCQMSAAAAAASFQLANFIGSTMLLPSAASASAPSAAATSSAIIAAAAATNTAGSNQLTSPTTTNAVAAAALMSQLTLTKKLPTSAAVAAVTHLSNKNNLASSKIANSSSCNSSNLLQINQTPKKSTVQFHCEFCAFSCSWKYDLKLHLRQKHGIHNKKM